MSLPRLVAVAPASAADRAGLAPGDEIVTLNGRRPRDVIEWQFLADAAELELEVRRGGLEREVSIHKRDGEPLGVEVDAPLFDRVQTCDNHCAFCFIHQLPTGLRRSLYVKDDDYRLSFLYGNYTTLTRFTELDLERVVAEGLSPINVSIHTTDPARRAAILRNRRGATSLRWLRALLDHGVEVHGQVVVCPDVNDGAVLEDTMAGVLDEYPELASLCVVPLGVSRFNRERSMRPHTRQEAEAVVDTVEDWQGAFLQAVGRRVAFAADEYYLLAGRSFPPTDAYEGFPMHEDGVGMARAFEDELLGRSAPASAAADRSQPGFFASVDGAPAVGYRAPRVDRDDQVVDTSASRGSRAPARSDTPVALITGELGGRVLAPLLAQLPTTVDVRVLPVANEFFGGNIGVTGLLVGADIARALGGQPHEHRYLLPDVCLSHGRFLDGTGLDELPRPVEVVPADGASLRAALVG